MRQRVTQEESVGHSAEGHRFCGGHTVCGVNHSPDSYLVATRGPLSPWVKVAGA